MEWRLPRVVVAAAMVTTRAKPHAQQQLARDVEVENAAMGQRRRPQSFGGEQRCNPLYSCELRLCFCIADVRGGIVVGALLPISLSGKIKDGLGINMAIKNCFIFVPVQQYKHHVKSITWSGVSPAWWLPQRLSRLVPSRTHGSN